jgi:hypothetical protein
MSVVSSVIACVLLAALDVPALAPAPAPMPARTPAPVVSVENRAVASQPGNTLTMEIGPQTTFTAVDRDRVQSHAVELQRTEDSVSGFRLSGFVGEEESDLHIVGSRVRGHVGSSRVSLEVTRANGPNGAITASGVFGGRAVELALAQDSIEGDVGPCHYALRNRRGDYMGTADCGGAPTTVRMQLPVALAIRGDAELAAILIALLAS